MKLSKRILSLLIISSISISVVGCDNKKEISEDTPTQYEEVSENINSDEQKDINNNTITEEEALKIVEGYVHQVVPEYKLKIFSKEYINGSECYVIKHDGSFATIDSFIVNVQTGEVKVYTPHDNTYENIEEWLEYSKETLEKMGSSEIAKEKAFKVLPYKSGENYRPELSENQMNNTELAVDYPVQVFYGNWYWVFKYPMEEEHGLGSDESEDYTLDNAYDKNDKFGYFYASTDSLFASLDAQIEFLD